MKTIIIIPTYNELNNIAPLLEALQAQFARTAPEMWP
jgi:glycosyltransferase involved in cell wall biosynthesis